MGSRLPSTDVPDQLAVVELRADCDLDDPEQYSASPGGTSFRVVEYAVLSDGRRVTLLDDRGWTQWSHGLGAAEARQLRAEDVRRDVLNVVLPDNAETTGEDHEWDHFVERLRDAGVDVPRDQLRRLPYRIVFGDRLQAELRDE
jgi:hypothetical protein